MKAKTNKSSKIRELICSNCGKKFLERISPSEIKSRKTFSCSKLCKSANLSRFKTKGTIDPCIICGKLVHRSPSVISRNHGRYCSRVCAGTSKNGKAISIDGYYTYNGIKVHRTIMAEHLGRKLTYKDIVHHINGNKLDNRIENLELMDRGEHNRRHYTYDRIKKCHQR